MKPKDIADLRMRNLRLTGTPLKTAEEVIRWLGAVQSQEFGPAKWSIAERTRALRDADVTEAFNRGSILRTHVLRPTWHFVLPEDIRWMLELTGPRVLQTLGSYNRKVGLDAALTKKCNRLIARALERRGHLTRQELRAVLNKAGVPAEGQLLNHIVGNAELHGVICSGELREKKHTYALLEERAPNAKKLSGDEALAELTLRYFTGHGPATAKDFRWWGSLPLSEIRRGLEIVGSKLESETIEGRTYWFHRSSVRLHPRAPRVHLLQIYDELVVGYTESRSAFDIAGMARTSFPEIAGGALTLDGQVLGSYKRTNAVGETRLEATLFRPFNRTETKELKAAAQRLERFLGRPVEITTHAQTS